LFFCNTKIPSYENWRFFIYSPPLPSIYHPDYPHHRNTLRFQILWSYRENDISQYVIYNHQDITCMARHQQQDDMDPFWFLSAFPQIAKETLCRVSLGILLQFWRVGSCTLFWFWCDEIFEKYVTIYRFTSIIFFHCELTTTLFSCTFTRLHRETNQIISRLKRCREVRFYLGISDVVYSYSCHMMIIYDTAKNQIPLFYFNPLKKLNISVPPFVGQLCGSLP